MVKVDRLPSGSYRARVNLGNGKYKTFTGKDKKEVQLKAVQFESEVENAPENANSVLTVREAMEKYTEAKKNVLSPTTYRCYKSYCENAFTDIAETPLNSLTNEQLQISVSSAAAELSPKSVRNMYALFSSTLKMFLPGKSYQITLPQKKKTGVQIPTETEVIALFREIKDSEIEVPIYLAALCALRMSEVLGLKWSSVDLENGWITVENARVMGEKNFVVTKIPKTSAGYRKIQIIDEVCQVLKKHYDPESEYVVNLTAASIYKRYQTALKHCCPGKHYTFHELRHYAASVMLMLNRPVKYIAKYLGHETTDMVNRVYGHIMSDKQDEIFSIVNTYYSGIFTKLSQTEK